MVHSSYALYLVLDCYFSGGVMKKSKYKKAPKIMKYVVIFTETTDDAEEITYKYTKTKAEAMALFKTFKGSFNLVQVYRLRYEWHGAWEV
jgi:hypothetical protein